MAAGEGAAAATSGTLLPDSDASEGGGPQTPWPSDPGTSLKKETVSSRGTEDLVPEDSHDANHRENLTLWVEEAPRRVSELERQITRQLERCNSGAAYREGTRERETQSWARREVMHFSRVLEELKGKLIQLVLARVCHDSDFTKFLGVHIDYQARKLVINVSHRDQRLINKITDGLHCPGLLHFQVPPSKDGPVERWWEAEQPSPLEMCFPPNRLLGLLWGSPCVIGQGRAGMPLSRPNTHPKPRRRRGGRVPTDSGADSGRPG